MADAESNITLRIKGDVGQAVTESQRLRQQFGADLAEMVRAAVNGSQQARQGLEDALNATTQATRTATAQQAGAFRDMWGTIEAGRQQFVTSSIRANEQFASSAISSYIKVAEEAKKAAQVEIDEAQRAQAAVSRARQQAYYGGGSLLSGLGQVGGLGLGGGSRVGYILGDFLRVGAALERVQQQAAQAQAALAAAGESASGLGAIFGSIGAAGGPILLSVAAIAGFTVAAGAATYAGTKLALDAAAYGDEIYKASLKTKLTTEQLSGLKVVAQENNVSFEQLVTGLSRYLKNVEDAAQGNKKLAKEFQSLGIDVTNLGRDPERAISELWQALNRLGPTAEENQAVITLMGRAGANLIPVLREMGGDINAATEKARKMNLLFGQDMTQAARDAEVRWRDFKLTLEGVSISIGEKLLPWVDKVIIKFTEWVQSAQLERIGDSINTQITAFTNFFKAIYDGAQAGLVPVEALYNKIQQIRELVLPGYLGGTWEDPSKALKVAGAQPVPLPSPEQRQAEDRARLIEGTKASIEEAQKAEKTATERLKLEYEERKISLQKYTTDQIAEANRLYQATVSLLDQRRALLAEELKAYGNDLKEREKIGKQIEEVDKKITEAEETKNQAELRLRTEEHRKLEEAEQQHQDRLITISKRTAQARIQALREGSRGDPMQSLAIERQVADIQNRLYEQEHKAAEDELSRAGARDDLRQKALDKIRALEVEHTAIVEEQTARRLDAYRREFAEIERRFNEQLKREHTLNQSEIDEINASARQRAISYESAATQVRDIKRKEFADREEVLNKLYDAAQKGSKQEEQILALSKQLAAERVKMEKDSADAIIAARDKDLQNLQKFAVEVTKIEAQLNKERLDAQKFELEYLKQTAGLRGSKREDDEEILQKQLDYETAVAREHKRLELQRLADEEYAAQQHARTMEEHLHITELYNSRRIEVQKQFNEVMKRLWTEFRAAMQLLDPTSPRSIFGDAFANELKDSGSKWQAWGAMVQSALDNVSKNVKNMGDIMQSAFDSMVQGSIAVLKNWILMGETGPAAFRKIAAEAIAMVAEQAAVNAIFWTAQGIVDLFWNPARATADFTAAAIWAGIAGGTAIAGRAVAGNAFQRSSGAVGGGGGAPSTAGGTAPPYNAVGVPTSGPTGPVVTGKTIRHVVELRPPSGWVTQEIWQGYHTNDEKLTNVFRHATKRYS